MHEPEESLQAQVSVIENSNSFIGFLLLLQNKQKKVVRLLKMFYQKKSGKMYFSKMSRVDWFIFHQILKKIQNFDNH